ncbi:transcriptional regulator [Bacillus cereus]|nr:transcriptional regulator [Bacillus cereus]
MLWIFSVKKTRKRINNKEEKNDRLKTIPGQKKKKLVLLEHLVSKLNAENQYTEKEMNTFIKQYHEDFCTIRREFIVYGFMDREDNMYYINEREVWTKWEELK